MGAEVVIRADASLEIGHGHVMRCLTLADQLKRRGAQVSFVCRDIPGNLIGLVEGKGYPVVPLAGPGPLPAVWGRGGANGSCWEADAEGTIAALERRQPQWLVVDSYQLAVRWEQRLRPHVRRIMVIDDLADRPHDCELLLDQNLYDDLERRYDKLVPAGCRKLLGPRYALLRDEFVAARSALRERDGVIRRVLVFFGGCDPSNETEKALSALKSLARPDIAVDVVAGAGNPNLERIRQLCRRAGHVKLHVQTCSMAQLMAQADLFVGSGGTTSWERCFLGLPSIVWVVADNQLETTRALARRDLITCLGCHKDVEVKDVVNALHAALGDSSAVREMGSRAVSLMDHRGDWISCAMGMG